MPAKASDLVRLIVRLEAELERFEHLGAEACRMSLESQAGLERGRKRLEALADAQGRLDAQVGELAQTLGGLRERQQAAAEQVSAWATRLQERITAFAALRERCRRLGAAAAELKVALPERPDLEVLGEIQRRVEDLAAQASAIADHARTAGFHDLEVEAEGKATQLLASARKLSEHR